jgi:hypothetical protein
MPSHQSSIRPRISVVALAAMLGTLFTPPATADGPGPSGSYAVIASPATQADDAWGQVVRQLRRKHDAALIVAESPEVALPALRRIRPHYVCWVAPPDELGRSAIVHAHRALRRIDDDPYTDAIWGVLTGYDADDAVRIVSRGEPLVVRRVLSGTSAVGLDGFDAGIQLSERRAGGRWVKRSGGEVVFEEGFPADSTQGLVDALNAFKPDMFITSGHATERDWQIGYSYADGRFRCAAGRLYGEDTHGKQHPVDSPNSKVFLGVGNCLIGNIPDRECMALALLHSAGVDQMFGYTAVTFYGYMGWGALEYFDGKAGQYTLAEALFAVNQALVHELVTRFPEQADVDFEHYDDHAIEVLRSKYDLHDRDLIGLLWDRDVVALYGDPGWAVRRPARALPWQQTLRRDDDVYTFTITTERDGDWGAKPIVQLLPQRIGHATVHRGEEYMPVITDDFVLLPLRGKFRRGESFELVFRAAPAESMRTSAGQKPIVVPTSAAPAETDEPPATAARALPVGIPDAYCAGVARALSEAGDNAAELRLAIERAPEGRRPAVCFLIANMPPADCRSLSAEFLLENVARACEARATLPWGAGVPEELFLNYVLPYASINERRDNWRGDFLERFAGTVRDCDTMAAAAARLNATIYGVFGVQYHASKRPKADQSPYESIDAGYASCTGLSVLLVDACRAVGIPARFVGTPQWINESGNHSWVEIWDRQWAYLGAAEPDPRGVNHAWFAGAAAEADPDSRIHSIYAASFRRTETHFPLVWDMSRRDVPALNVTRRYTDAIDVRFRAVDAKEQPVAGTLRVRWEDELYAVAELSPDAADTTLRLPRQTLLRLEFTRADGAALRRALFLDATEATTVTIDASDFAAEARRYRCRFTATPPQIDGRLDDAAWEAAPWSETFVDIRGSAHPTPPLDTRMKMTWDDTHLYVAAELTEPHLWGTLTQHDDVIFYDDDFEIFIDPDGDGQAYYEIEVNTLNTIFDLFLVRTYRDGGPALHDWDMRDLRSAVHLEGTLNDPRDTDRGWTVEFALPWRSLKEAARVPAPPRPGDMWRMNFSRVDWTMQATDAGYRKVPNVPEDNWVWSPQGVVDMHRPATWGYVTFER